MNSASYEYRNMSARRGAQFVPMGIEIHILKQNHIQVIRINMYFAYTLGIRIKSSRLSDISRFTHFPPLTYRKKVVFCVTIFARACYLGHIHETLFSMNCTKTLTREIMTMTLFSILCDLANLR